MVSPIKRAASNDRARRRPRHRAKTGCWLRGLQFESLEPRLTLAADLAGDCGRKDQVTGNFPAADRDADLRVTPRDSLLGISRMEDGDLLYDTNGDGFHSPLDELIVIQNINQQEVGTSCPDRSYDPSAVKDPLVEISVVVVDSTGQPVLLLAAGQEFSLNVYAEDLRPRPEGIFAAYADITYPADWDLPTKFEPAAPFNNGIGVRFTKAGLIDEVGGFSNSFQPTGLEDDGDRNSKLLIGTIPMGTFHGQAIDIGVNPADELPSHNILLYGLDEPVPPSRVKYSLATGHDEIVQISLVATDLQGQPLTSVAVGSEFQIQLVAADLRENKLGVFAAYMDVSYPASAVVAGGYQAREPFMERVSFDSSKIGLLNEAGGSSKSILPNGDGTFVIGTQRFKATEVGKMQFMTNPADDLPSHNVLIYGSDDPVVNAGLDLNTKMISAIRSSQLKSTTTVVTVVPKNSPLPDPPPANDKPLVQLSVIPTDLLGNPIQTVAEGDDFQVRFVVEDLRPDPQGVFAFYADMTYPDALVSSTEKYEPTAPYTGGVEGDVIQTGLVDEFGGFSEELRPVGGGKFVLGTLKFTAHAAGTAKFATNPADLLPHHDILLYGINDAIDPDQVDFGGGIVQIPTSRIRFKEAELLVTGEAGSLTVPDNPKISSDSPQQTLDVMANDTDLNPATATIQAVSTPDRGGTVAIISDRKMLRYQPQAGFIGVEQFQYTARNAAGHEESAQVTVKVYSRWQNQSLAADRNGDNRVVPLDALLGINRLNERGSGKLTTEDLQLNGQPIFFDTDGDGTHAPFDELLVFNYLNAHAAAEGADAEREMRGNDAAIFSDEMFLKSMLDTDFVRSRPSAKSRSRDVTTPIVANVTPAVLNATRTDLGARKPTSRCPEECEERFLDGVTLWNVLGEIDDLP